MLSNEYGRPVTQAQADKHFHEFMKIKKRVHKRLKELLEDDMDALRYYCGLLNEMTSDLGFVFDKDSIKQITDKMTKGEADGVIIFNGVRKKEDSRIGTSNEFSDIDGRPTLMIFPYKISQNPSTETTDEFELRVLTDDGSEHPGTGGGTGSTGILNEATGEYNVPKVFKASQIHKFM